ncbi:MAG TPA: PAS domain S-box protein [Roseomonas sp.]
MADNPGGTLQKCAELAMELCRADTAGISIPEPRGANGVLRWRAVAGGLAAQLGDTMLRNAIPGGMVTDRSGVLLSNDAERFFPDLLGIEPRIFESLLAPLLVNGQTAGMLWAIKHTPEGRFDAEDARLLKSFARFASAAHRMTAALAEANAARSELEERAEERNREAQERAMRLHKLVAANSYVIYRMSPGWTEMLELESHGFLPDRQGPSGNWLRKYVHPADQSLVAAAVQGALKNKSFFEVEHRVWRADGTLGWTLSRAVPLLDERGEVKEWFGTAIDVTAPKQAEIALRESEERLAAIFATASVGLSEIDPDGRFVRVNAELSRILGRPEESLLGVRILDVTHPDDVQITNQVAATVLEKGGTATIDKRYCRPDGTAVWAQSSVTRLQGAGGRPGNLLAVTADLTARRAAEEALRESEERLRLIVEGARDYAIFTTDPEDRITEWLPGAADVFGWSAEEAVGQLAAITFTPEDREAGGPEWEAEVARKEGAAPNVRWHMRKDGSRVYIEGSMTALRGPHGELRGFLRIGQDVTRRYEIERRLRESRREMRALIEGIPQLVWRAHEGGKWKWSSPQWSAFTGLSEEESRGMGWLLALHPEDRAAAEAAWASAVGGASLRMETRVFNKEEGQHHWFVTRAAPVRDEEGRVLEWLGTSTDVNDLRVLQERQAVLVAELQHRTRNLLGVVRALADRTAAGSTSFDDFRSRFRDRIGALARVQSLLSRKDVGQRVTFDELIRAELSGLGAIGGDGSGSQVTLDGPIGVRLRSTTVQTLALGLHELATNALKYGALSRPEGRLMVRWQVEKGLDGMPRLQLEWQESGVPIPLPANGAPVRRGYGRELIERALPYQLSAETRYELASDGVRCTITLPISAGGPELRDA